jgi:hypothetical protein
MEESMPGIRKALLRIRGSVFLNKQRLPKGEPPENLLTPITEQQVEFIRERFIRPKFFILGYPRSGTTLLARLIRLHPEIHCNWQAQFFSERGPVPVVCSPQFQTWINHPSNHWTEGENFTVPMLRTFYDLVLESGAEAVNKPIVGDKSPNDNGVQAVKWLSNIYPDAGLIYIVRDGRDAVFSKRVQAFIDQPQHLRREDRRLREALINDPRPFLEGRQSFFSERWLRAMASQWAGDVHECVAAGRDAYSDRFLLVKYEELLDDPWKCMTRAFDFLGARKAELQVEMSKEMENNPAADWHQSRGFEFTNYIPRGKHGIWREIFTDEDLYLFRESAGNVLSEFGYSKARGS